MIRTGIIALLVYYLVGTICLPMGDFSFTTDLPKMYHHCKTTEDKDLTPLDFVTDHLMNLDGIFDRHCNGDHQKPHSFPLLQHQPAQNVFVFQFVIDCCFQPDQVFKKKSFFYRSFYKSHYYSKIFHPPAS
jgi:hypothetical protein